MKDALFIRKEFTLHSGKKAHWKIECDSLTNEDLETLAWLVVQRVGHTNIKKVHGIPTGGVRFAKALEQYINPEGQYNLIVDDVLTTGGSMEQAKRELEWDNENTLGVVIYARGGCPDWIHPIFNMKWRIN